MRRLLIPSFLSLWVVACLDSDPPVSPIRNNAAGATPQISDGRHGNGNPHFFFLPPIVANPSASGAFDPTLNPVVEVCEWTTLCNQVIARFSRTSSSGGETIQVIDGEYRVNWKTTVCLSGPCTLDPSKTYRLSVAVSGVTLGFADLDVVANGSQLKNVETGEFIGLVEGKTLPVKFRIEEGAIDVVSSAGGSATITPSAGGTVATEDGKIVVEIPPGALSGTAPVEITVRPTASYPGNESVMPGSVVEFGPEGITFEKPVTIKLAYNPAQIPSGIPEQHLRLHTYDENAERWIPVDGTTSIDPESNTVSGDVRHFSLYGAGELPPPQFEWWSNYPARNNQVPPAAPEIMNGVPTYVLQLETGPIPPEGLDPGFVAVTALWDGGLHELNCVPPVLYESADPAIVSVDSVVLQGSDKFRECHQTTVQPVVLTTAHAVGTTFLRATVNGYSDSVKVIVTALQAKTLLYPFTGWQPKGYALNVGESILATVEVWNYFDAPWPTKPVAWTSDLPAIAQMVPTGPQAVSVTGLTPGCTWITTTVDDTLSDRFSLIVRPKPVDFAISGFGAVGGVATMTATGCGAEVIEGPGSDNTDLLRWSPDGSKIAWIGSNNGTKRIKVASWDGQGTVILPTFADVAHFSWSPDGSQIAYSAVDAAANVIHSIHLRVINADGSGDHLLAPMLASGEVADAPEWSPDGSRIAFHRGLKQTTARKPFTRIESRAVYTIRPDGTNEHVVVANVGGVSVGFPTWSPDGSRLLFMECLSSGSRRLAVANADGSGRLVLYNAPVDEWGCGSYAGFFDGPDLYDWSPNGQRVRFGTVIMNPNGSGALDLLGSTILPIRFSWSPNSTQLAYSPDGLRTFRVNADGTDILELTGAGATGLFWAVNVVRWRPSSAP